MDPKEKQKLYILFAIFGVAGLILYYNILLKPQFARFVVNNREYRAVKTRVRNAEALIASEERIREEYKRLKEHSEIVTRKLLAHDEIASLLEDFSNVAEETGVKILKLTPLEAPDTAQATQGQEFYLEFPIWIEASAGYHQFGTFVNKLESMDRFIKIQEIDVAQNASDPRRHNIKMRVLTYVKSNANAP